MGASVCIFHVVYLYIYIYMYYVSLKNCKPVTSDQPYHSNSWKNRNLQWQTLTLATGVSTSAPASSWSVVMLGTSRPCRLPTVTSRLRDLCWKQPAMASYKSQELKLWSPTNAKSCHMKIYQIWKSGYLRKTQRVNYSSYVVVSMFRIER